jgi:glucokinase
MTQRRARRTPAAGSSRLLADIGATNVRFALESAGRLQAKVTWPCARFGDFTAAAREFLANQVDVISPTRAALGIAAPFTGTRIKMTNHPWTIDLAAIRDALGLEYVAAINDVAAVAMAIPWLNPGELAVVKPGTAVRDATAAVLAPGTGLGVAALLSTPKTAMAIASEGGHATLSAIDEGEAALIAILRAWFGHVSVERVLSGPGLVNLYRAIAQRDGQPAETLDPAGIIERAQEGSCVMCREAVARFCDFLGSMAGDVALMFTARGGIYLAGGVALGVPTKFLMDGLARRFTAKGRYAGFLEPIPVFLITSAIPAFTGLTQLLNQDPDEYQPGVVICGAA